MVSLKWTQTALQDIERIAVFISRDSEFYAKQFVQKLINTTLTLEKFPDIGKLLPELPKSEYREILFKKYRVIYRINS